MLAADRSAATQPRCDRGPMLSRSSRNADFSRNTLLLQGPPPHEIAAQLPKHNRSEARLGMGARESS
jgi:hypothetical protein